MEANPYYESASETTILQNIKIEGQHQQILLPVCFSRKLILRL